MRQYTFSTNEEFDIKVNREEREHAYKTLATLSSTSEAIMYLHSRRWPTEMICETIMYPNGEKLEASHVEKVRAAAWFLSLVKDCLIDELSDDREFVPFLTEVQQQQHQQQQQAPVRNFTYNNRRKQASKQASK